MNSIAMPSPVIINPGEAIRPAPLVEPAPVGYVLLTAAVDPQSRPGPVRPSRTRNAVLSELAELGRALRGRHPGCRVELFRGAAFPPFQAMPIPDKYRDAIGRYDVAVLLRAASTEDLPGVEGDPAYHDLLGLLGDRGGPVVVTKARNARRIADVPPGDSLHLFNFFLADDDPAALHVWQYLAGWYYQEMNMRDSEVLLPLEPEKTPFAFVNHASWNIGLAKFVARQMSRGNFRSFVIANLAANSIGSLPFLYRPYRASGGV